MTFTELLVVVFGTQAVIFVAFGLWVRRRPREPFRSDSDVEPASKRVPDGATPTRPVVYLRTGSKSDVAHRCAHCAFFDLDEGQAIMRTFPAFAEATRWVSPRRMSQRYGDDGELLQDTTIPVKAKWSEFGACEKHSELRWSDDHCEAFKPDLQVADVAE